MKRLRIIAAAALLVVSSCGTSSRSHPPQQRSTATDCEAGSICFRVFGAAPGPIQAGRLQVAWHSPSDDDGVGPHIAYDAPFNGTERMVQIPQASIARPTIPQCRGCTAGLMAWGYVVVVPMGRRQSLSKSSIVGAGQMLLVYAENATQQAPLLRDKFPAGIAEGTAAYHTERGRGSFDHLVLAPPGTLFDLVVCNVGKPHCNLPLPNPS